MSDILVIYGSKYGATRQYAEWIAQMSEADLVDINKVSARMLRDYDTIVYGGAKYGDSLSGLPIFLKYYPKIQNKNLIVFTCGIKDPTDIDVLSEIHHCINQVFTNEMIERIQFFHLRGAMDYKHLGILHKTMLAVVLRNIESRKAEGQPVSASEEELLEVCRNRTTYVSRLAVEPIVEYVQILSSCLAS